MGGGGFESDTAGTEGVTVLLLLEVGVSAIGGNSGMGGALPVMRVREN